MTILPPDMKPAPSTKLGAMLLAYRMRWKRRRLLFRALRKRRQMSELHEQTHKIAPDDVLVFAALRNEIRRLPYFLRHYRELGVNHFLIVDNDSDDGTAEYLRSQADVSVWTSRASYKLSRFGMDWLTWLMIRHGHDHWCLTVDADELLIYPHWDTRPLAELTKWLETTGAQSFGALMLDMYPKGHIGEQSYEPDQNPTEVLAWFDTGNYVYKYQPRLKNLLVRGGVRYRKFFSSQPERAPTLSKTPLVKWSKRYVYVSSTHSLLPPNLNDVRGDTAPEAVSGVLLHTKFLPSVIDKTQEELNRRQHFENSELYQSYYAALLDDPDFWTPDSCQYQGWQHLEKLGLMSRGNW